MISNQPVPRKKESPPIILRIGRFTESRAPKQHRKSTLESPISLQRLTIAASIPLLALVGYVGWKWNESSFDESAIRSTPALVARSAEPRRLASDAPEVGAATPAAPKAASDPDGPILLNVSAADATAVRFPQPSAEYVPPTHSEPDEGLDREVDAEGQQWRRTPGRPNRSVRILDVQPIPTIFLDRLRPLGAR